ncbi:MAG: PASTA domain-containing protein [Crocinitomix sp.]|nr:PASTA domain-containing protein [Crocinitomix sp.]
MALELVKNISFILGLNNADGTPVNDMEVAIQYLDELSLEWKELQLTNMVDGRMTSLIKTSSKAKAVVPFINLIKTNNLPLVRIIPTLPIYQAEVVELIAPMDFFYTDLIEEEMSLIISFGERWLIDKADFPGKVFGKTHALVSSGVSPARALEYLAKIDFLDKENLALQDSILSLNDEIKARKAEFEKLKSDAALCAKKITELANELKTKNADLEKQAAEILRLTEVIASLNKEIEVRNAEIEKLLANEALNKEEILRLTNEVKALTLELEKLRKELVKVKADNTKKDTVIRQMKADIAAFKKDIKDMKTAMKVVEKDKGAVMAELEVVRDVIVEKEDALAEISAVREELMVTLEDAKLEMAKYDEALSLSEKEIEALTSRTADLEVVRDELSKEITELELAVTKGEDDAATCGAGLEVLSKDLIAKEAIIREKEAAIAAVILEKDILTSRISDLEAMNEELSRDINFDERPLPIKTFYSNIVSEIDVAKSKNEGAYKLSNISLKIKTFVTRDTEGVTSVQLLSKDTAEGVNSEMMSELSFDVVENNFIGTTPGNVPNLIGHTETAVRRILSSQGLRLNEVYQSNLSVPNGQSFKQSPAANTPAQLNDLITVIFSKHG